VSACLAAVRIDRLYRHHPGDVCLDQREFVKSAFMKQRVVDTEMYENLNLRAGEWVEIRSKYEILSTLDKQGQFDGLPFMPEMFAFCGMRLRVYKRAHKTCDTVFPIRSRRMASAVHLETRCNGQAHGGCQANCLIFWKEIWLKRVDEATEGRAPASFKPEVMPNGSTWTGGCSESDVLAATREPESPRVSELVYRCQATRLPYATTDLWHWDIRQYLEDYSSGNVGIGRILSGVVWISYYSLHYVLSKAGVGLGKIMPWFYDKFHPLWRGTPFPRRTGRIPVGEPTPSRALNLQPGELVRVRSLGEILETLNTESKNRGLMFDQEMVPFCGKTYRVLQRVSKIINEQTGKMQEMKTPCIMLASVFCQSRYSKCRLLCPRSIPPYWREIWLERVSESAQGDANHELTQRALPKRT
jgi:hypothetical protein